MKAPYTLEEWQSLLIENHVEGRRADLGREYSYTRPASEKSRLHQWLWDSSFHAIMLAQFEPHQAKAEIRTLLRAQYKNGLVPMVSFWAADRDSILRRTAQRFFYQRYLVKEPPGSILTQPPVVAHAVYRVFEATRDRAFVEEVLPAVRRFYDYLLSERDFDADGLVSIIHPLESGTDFLPEFDTGLGIVRHLPLGAFFEHFRLWHRYNRGGWRLTNPSFDYESVMFNAITGLNLFYLAKLCELGNDTEAAGRYRKASDRIAEELCKKAFDDERQFFFGLFGKNEQPIRVKTISGLFPLILPQLKKEYVARIVEHLNDPREFGVPYPVPSVAQSERSFASGQNWYLWRGTTWIPANWYLQQGLLMHGFQKEAAALAERSEALIRTSGFREYYNSLTGEGYGGHDYGWSTLVVDMRRQLVASSPS